MTIKQKLIVFASSMVLVAMVIAIWKRRPILRRNS